MCVWGSPAAPAIFMFVEVSRRQATASNKLSMHEIICSHSLCAQVCGYLASLIRLRNRAVILRIFSMKIWQVSEFPGTQSGDQRFIFGFTDIRICWLDNSQRAPPCIVYEFRTWGFLSPDILAICCCAFSGSVLASHHHHHEPYFAHNQQLGTCPTNSRHYKYFQLNYFLPSMDPLQSPRSTMPMWSSPLHSPLLSSSCVPDPLTNMHMLDATRGYPSFSHTSFVRSLSCANISIWYHLTSLSLSFRLYLAADVYLPFMRYYRMCTNISN